MVGGGEEREEEEREEGLVGGYRRAEERGADVNIFMCRRGKGGCVERNRASKLLVSIIIVSSYIKYIRI